MRRAYIVLLLSTLILTGFLNVETETKINEDGSGYTKTRIVYDLEYMSFYLDEEIQPESLEMSESELRDFEELIREPYEREPGIVVSDVKVDSTAEEFDIYCKVTFNDYNHYSNISSEYNIFGESTSEFTVGEDNWKFYSKAYRYVIFDYGYGVLDDLPDDYGVELVCIFPGKVEFHNGDSRKSRGNKVVWEYTLAELGRKDKLELKAEGKISSGRPSYWTVGAVIIGIIVVSLIIALTVLIGAYLYLYRKRNEVIED